MSDELNSYFQNSQRVRSLIGFHEAVRETLTNAMDISDILRAGHVLAVSALDSYVHEISRAAMMEIYDGSRAHVPGYTRFRVSLGNFADHRNFSAARSNIEGDIREQHGYLSFQHPDKIADAIRCVSAVKLWEEVGTLLNLPPKSIKERLILIVDRRNKIAHEADIDPTYGTLWPINYDDVVKTVDFLDSVVSKIDEVVDL